MKFLKHLFRMFHVKRNLFFNEGGAEKSHDPIEMANQESTEDQEVKNTDAVEEGLDLAEKAVESTEGKEENLEEWEQELPEEIKKEMDRIDAQNANPSELIKSLQDNRLFENSNLDANQKIEVVKAVLRKKTGCKVTLLETPYEDHLPYKMTLLVPTEKDGKKMDFKASCELKIRSDGKMVVEMTEGKSKEGANVIQTIEGTDEVEIERNFNAKIQVENNYGAFKKAFLMQLAFVK